MINLECVMYIVYLSTFKLQKKIKERGSLSFHISLIRFTLIHSLYRYLPHAFFLTVVSSAVILA